jgi:hypothetical protein
MTPDPEVEARVWELIRARGADYERRVEDRRKRERERKREARKHQTTEQRKDECGRKREARKRQTPEQREREKQRESARDRRKTRPFIAIDGEGGGTDGLGRQNYLLMVASGSESGEERIVHRNGVPLSTKDCLEFILSLPKKARIVAFGFGYDVTQMLRGVKEQSLRRIINPRQGSYGPLPTYWSDYAITYQQGQYFRVARLNRSGPKPVVIKGSSRTVYETLGFFQCSFVKAIDNWGIGCALERSVIAENKDRRSEFSRLTPEIIEYCKLECRYLALLMEALRSVCAKTGISPKQWRGAGWLAAALFEQHNVPKRPLTRAEETADRVDRKPSKNPKPERLRRPKRDPEFERAANSAYYGGRIEVSRIGSIPGPIYQYDLNSAYPSAMLELPCLYHTRWRHRPRANNLPTKELYLAKISFTHPDRRWCGFPFRHNGGLFSPFQGTGWYWSPEIKAAQARLGASIVVHDLWIARCSCDCRRFDWVRDLYKERRRLGSDTRGQPIKLALNSLYGKLAQRCGRGPYHDPASAGLITAITRARLIDAIGQDPEAVIMLATDAVFSTRPLQLDIGAGLGQWEEKVWQDLFIVKPGVYWSRADVQKSIKSRGASRSVIGTAAHRFHEAFGGWLDRLRRPSAMRIVLKERLIPSVPVTIRVFYGHRLALARSKPDLAGKWEDVTRHDSFEWGTKRDAMRITLGDSYIATYPIALSSPLTESEGYKPADFDRLVEISGESGNREKIDENVLLEAMPDFMPFLPRE